MEARSIYDYESGNRTPNINVFQHLCRLYEGTDVLYEFGYDIEKPPDLTDEKCVDF